MSSDSITTYSAIVSGLLTSYIEVEFPEDPEEIKDRIEDALVTDVISTLTGLVSQMQELGEHELSILSQALDTNVTHQTLVPFLQDVYNHAQQIEISEDDPNYSLSRMVIHDYVNRFNQVVLYLKLMGKLNGNSTAIWGNAHATFVGAVIDAINTYKTLEQIKSGVIYQLSFPASISNCLNYTNDTIPFKITPDTPEVLQNIDLSQATLEEKNKVRLVLAIREIITNAYKYTMARVEKMIEAQEDIDFSELTVHSQISFGDGQLVISVIDAGVGLGSNASVPHSTGFGVQSIVELMKELGGEYNLGKREDGVQGTKATLKLPINLFNMDFAEK